MAKERKLIDLAKRGRGLVYRINNFFKYRLLVNSKHILIVGGDGTYMKQKLIDNFKDTWRIATISAGQKQEELDQQNPNIPFNFNLNEIDYSDQNQVEDLLVKLTDFSKHFECMICLNELSEKQGDIQDLEIFDQFEKQQKNIVMPNILTSYLASHLLTDNGVLMYQGDQQSFEKATPNMPSFSIAMNQLNQLNLIMGEREDLSVDAATWVLLDRDQSKDIKEENSSSNEKDKKESKEDKGESENSSSNNNSDNVFNVGSFAESKAEVDQLVEMIRIWGEGQSRPMSGSFVKFEKIGNQIYPKSY